MRNIKAIDGLVRAGNDDDLKDYRTYVGGIFYRLLGVTKFYPGTQIVSGKGWIYKVPVTLDD